MLHLIDLQKFVYRLVNSWLYFRSSVSCSVFSQLIIKVAPLVKTLLLVLSLNCWKWEIIRPILVLFSRLSFGSIGHCYLDYLCNYCTVCICTVFAICTLYALRYNNNNNNNNNNATMTKRTHRTVHADVYNYQCLEQRVAQHTRTTPQFSIGKTHSPNSRGNLNIARGL